MTAQTPGCGCNSEARKRQAERQAEHFVEVIDWLATPPISAKVPPVPASQHEPDRQWMNQAEAAEYLGVTDRTIRAYLPPSYGENTRARYPVVYMHDGQNLFDPALAFGGVEWRVDEAFDAAGETGRCSNGASCTNDGDCSGGGGGVCATTREAIVIGIDNAPDRIWELGVSVFSRYNAPYTEEMKPFVELMLNKRVVVKMNVERVISWDHRKLGGSY